MRSQRTTARHGRGRRRAFTTAFCSLLVFAIGLGQAVIPAANAGAPTLTMGQAKTTSGGQLAAAATLSAGAVSVDFIAAGHTSYNHATGVGGSYGNRSIGPNGVEESLEGQDFACGDKIVYFAAVTVDPGAANGDIDLKFSFDGTTTSGSMVGINDLVSATLNSPDSGNKNLDGNETVSIQSESGPPPAGKDVTATVRVTGLDGSEQLIVRLVTNLWCDPFETSVTGNIHANLDDANVVGGSKINVGQQTVPLKQAGNILFPGLNVLKSCPATGSVGGTITYQITVENTGQDTLNNIHVNDTILGDLSASFADSLAGGASETHSFSYTLTATPDPITNVVTATATAAQSATELSDTADCTTDVLFPNLGIAKTADKGSVNAGEPIGYTITVTNSGQGKAFDVVMTDTLPTNPGLTWSVGSTTGGWSCAISTGVLTCGGEGFDLASGASASVHITSDTDATTCGVIDNTATVTIGNGDGDSDGASITVNCPDLGIDIQKGGPDLAHVGDTITYTFDVSLTTPEPLFDVTVTDPNCNEGAPVYVSGDNGNNILEPEETWTYTCTHVVTSEDPDPLPNTATVQGTADDGRSTTDEDSHQVDLIHPGIDIVKTVNPVSGQPGDTVTYTYEVTNTGDTTLYDVSVDDDVIGHIGNIAELAAGETVTLTKDWVLPANPPVVTNVGTGTGTDVLGKTVSADDDAVVTIVEAIHNPPKPPPPTAFTGSDALRLGLVTLALLALGLLALGVSRRRGRHEVV